MFLGCFVGLLRSLLLWVLYWVCICLLLVAVLGFGVVAFDVDFDFAVLVLVVVGLLFDYDCGFYLGWLLGF